MAGTATTAAAVLALALVWAAVAKGSRREATAGTFRALRLPAPRVLAVAVPVAEVGAAGVLVVRPAAGALVALGLLAAFTAVVVRALLSGVSIGCGCFGGVGNDPVGPPDVLRNGMLAALAALATGASRPVTPSLGQASSVLGAVAAGMAILSALHRMGRVPGSPAPNRDGKGADGGGARGRQR